MPLFRGCKGVQKGGAFSQLSCDCINSAKKISSSVREETSATISVLVEPHAHSNNTIRKTNKMGINALVEYFIVIFLFRSIDTVSTHTIFRPFL